MSPILSSAPRIQIQTGDCANAMELMESVIDDGYEASGRLQNGIRAHQDQIPINSKGYRVVFALPTLDDLGMKQTPYDKIMHQIEIMGGQICSAHFALKLRRQYHPAVPRNGHVTIPVTEPLLAQIYPRWANWHCIPVLYDPYPEDNTATSVRRIDILHLPERHSPLPRDITDREWSISLAVCIDTRPLD